MDYSYGIQISSQKWPKGIALICDGLSYTHSELNRRINQLANGLLNAGVRQKDRVAFVLQNSPPAVELYMALARIGAVAVPINTRSVGAEIAHILNDSGAKMLVYDQTYEVNVNAGINTAYVQPHCVIVGEAPDDAITGYDKLLDAPDTPPNFEVNDSDVACLLYTSGTTGKPKGVERTHGGNLINITNVLLSSPRLANDIEMYSLPISGIGYIHFLLPSLFSGATVVLLPKFDARLAWETLVKYQVTRTFLAPTMIQSMLDIEDHSQYQLSIHTLDTAYEIPDRIRKQIVTRFGENIFHLYGLTEAQLFSPSPGAFIRTPGANGKPMGLMEYKVVDEQGNTQPTWATGELWLRGPSVMKGYYGNQVATADVLHSGWLKTGDLGFLDENQDFYFTGRRKEIIKSGGFNVDPTEIENHLFNHPAIKEAAVIGTPNDLWGEAVIAFIVRRPETSISDIELAEFCRQSLSSYKIPKRFLYVAEIPKNATGKIERARLRELAALPENEIKKNSV